MSEMQNLSNQRTPTTLETENPKSKIQNPKSLYIAIDLGAGSGRVFLAGVSPDEFLLEQLHRFHYPPRELDGHLRWDFQHICSEIQAGLAAAAIRANELHRPIHSIGVDSWAIDYGLLDANGNLIEDPICYRDLRTIDVMEQAYEVVPQAEIYARTGIQFININTLFQLFAHQQEGIHAAADKLLLIPDLINFWLTGNAVTEYTNATTMQLINAERRTWDEELIARFDFPRQLFTNIIDAGTTVGTLRPELAQMTGLPEVKVVAPATHDTGSAVAGTPLQSDWAYISSGTWSLVGVELNDALINAETGRHNFTNEGGAFGTIRFLKNVMGLWVLESCRREWQSQGLTVDYDVLLREVAARSDFPALLYPDDIRFFNPPSMIAAIQSQVSETNQLLSDDPVLVTKAILDSLALRYASVIRTIEALTSKPLSGVQIVGGGSQNDYLNQATANAIGKPVLAGPVEATVIGNIAVQAVAAGRFANLAEARQYIAANVTQRRFDPRSDQAWTTARAQYAEIEARFIS
jgi:rhamnulokinase